MIVQCPSCASRYRVNDANVPSSGGKITCPSCQHKFIVYPEEQSPAAGSGAESNDLEDKTSVAFRPDLNKLVSQMQQGGQAGGGQAGGGQAGGGNDDGVAATEVMSGDNIPDFLEGLADDGTVEMQNPFGDAPPGSSANEMGGGEDALATEVVSGDMLDNLGFENPSNAQARQQAPPPKQPSQRPSVPAPPAAAQQSQGRQNHQAQNHQAQNHQAQNHQAQQSQPPASPQPPGRPSQPGAAGQLNQGQQNQGQLNQGQQNQVQQNQVQQKQAPPAAAAGPNPDHDGPWKLKTNFGLTYEFPDTKSLRSWLANREDLDGYKLSGDGDTFHALGAWPQIASGGGASASQQIPSFQQAGSPPPGGSNAGRGGSGAAGMPGNPLTSNPPPPSKPAPPEASSATGRKIQPKEYRPPSRDGQWNVLLWGIAFILMLVVGALCVQLFGLYDIKGDLLGMPTEQAQTADAVKLQAAPAQVAQGDEEVEAPADDGPDPKIVKEVTRLVGDARRAVENNRLQTAAEKLQNAKLLDPKRVEVYEMLATVYGKMGQDEEAEAAKQKAGDLQAAAEGGGEAVGEEASNN